MEVAPCSYQPGCAALGSVFPLLSSAVFCGGGAFSGLLAGHSAAGRGLAPFCFPQPGRLRYCTRDSALYLLEASLSCQTCQMLLILTATWWRPELPTQCCLLPSSWGFGGDPSSCPGLGIGRLGILPWLDLVCRNPICEEGTGLPAEPFLCL